MSAKLWSGPTREVYWGDQEERIAICVCCEHPTPTHEPECYLAALEAKLRAAEIEANRLYGVGQDIEVMRLALEAKLEAMGRRAARLNIILNDRFNPDDVESAFLVLRQQEKEDE